MKRVQAVLIVLFALGMGTFATIVPVIHYNFLGGCTLTRCEVGTSKSISDYYFNFGLEVVYFTGGGGSSSLVVFCPWQCG